MLTATYTTEYQLKIHHLIFLPHYSPDSHRACNQTLTIPHDTRNR